MGLLFTREDLKHGSRLTADIAEIYGKSYLHIDLNRNNQEQTVGEEVSWITCNDIKILNVAGTRASKDQNIYKDVYVIMDLVFSNIMQSKETDEVIRDVDYLLKNIGNIDLDEENKQRLNDKPAGKEFW